MKPANANQPLRIVHYPSLQKMMENPYWAMLASGTREAGMEILEEPESHKFHWLLKNRKKVDILHLHYIQSLYCNSGHTRARFIYVAKLALYLLLARTLGYRTVLTLHNLKPTHPLMPDWIDYLGHWVAANFTQRVIVHCREARRLLAARYGRKNDVYEVSHPHYIGYYPNTISKQDARRKLNLPADARVVLFLGGVRPNKGIETLIEAFKQLKEDDLILLIAGKPDTENNYANHLQQQAASDARIRFHFGFIPEDELQVYLNSSDIVVLPFSNILTSGSVILAMSFARPVVAPRMGCLPELLEPGAGWLYEAGNEKSLLITLKEASSSNHIGIGADGFKKVAEYTTNQFINQTIECYRSK